MLIELVVIGDADCASRPFARHRRHVRTLFHDDIAIRYALSDGRRMCASRAAAKFALCLFASVSAVFVPRYLYDDRSGVPPSSS